MVHFNKLSVVLYVAIGLILAFLVAMICYTGSAETANAFDDVYQLVDFSDSYGEGLVFPYTTNTVYYTTSSALLYNTNSTTISANTHFGQGTRFAPSSSSYPVTLENTVSTTSDITPYTINSTTISDDNGECYYYFVPYLNDNLKNTTIPFYINIYLDGTFSYVYLDFQVNGTYTTPTNIISSTYGNGISIKYNYGTSASNYFMRLRFYYTSSSFTMSSLVSNRPYAFILDDTNSNTLTNTNSYSGSFTSDSSAEYLYNTEIDFNLGTNVVVNDTYYWTYLYWNSLFTNSNPVFICDIIIDGKAITFPMYVGVQTYGIADTIYECIVGEFILNSYTYRLEFFNCNYDSNEFIYDYAFQLMNNQYSSYTITKFKLTQYNNVVNSQSYNDGYTYGYSNGYSSGYYQGGVDSNKDYNTGYSLGYTTGLEVAEDGSFLGLFIAAIESPLQAVLSMFDVEILGYNMKSLYMALITLALVLFIVRLIMTGSKGKSE